VVLARVEDMGGDGVGSAAGGLLMTSLAGISCASTAALGMC
jgi:hypothetical protein